MNKQKQIEEIEAQYSAAVNGLYGTPKGRGPYKRGPKSTETGPVAGVYEAPDAIPPMPKPEDYGWRPERPGANSGRGSFETKAQEQAYYDAFDRHVAAVNGQMPPPVITQRPNIPNRYDREALADFYDGPMLAPALALYEDCTNMGYTAKAAFSQVLFQLSASK